MKVKLLYQSSKLIIIINEIFKKTMNANMLKTKHHNNHKCMSMNVLNNVVIFLTKTITENTIRNLQVYSLLPVQS